MDVINEKYYKFYQRTYVNIVVLTWLRIIKHCAISCFMKPPYKEDDCIDAIQDYETVQNNNNQWSYL